MNVRQWYFHSEILPSRPPAAKTSCGTCEPSCSSSSDPSSALSSASGAWAKARHSTVIAVVRERAEFRHCCGRVDFDSARHHHRIEGQRGRCVCGAWGVYLRAVPSAHDKRLAVWGDGDTCLARRSCLHQLRRALLQVEPRNLSSAPTDTPYPWAGEIATLITLSL